MIQGKKILIGITGSIAAYKSALLIRLLKKQGAEIKVVMTAAAQSFITPLTIATLADHEVYSDFTEDQDSGKWTNHVALGLWADLMIVAPLSANTLGKMANGVCDNFLLATYLSAKCPVFVAPAMDLDMYKHPSTTNNLSKISSFGNHIIDPEDGELASGLVGKGRMAEPEHIVEVILNHFNAHLPLHGKKALVTAGPTYEKIDAVRFIGNFSSGKMGYALAQSLANQGAQVTLVSGPTHLSLSHPNLIVVPVISASEMLKACKTSAGDSDIIVMSAAVADYRPTSTADHKIKKTEEALSIQLEPTEDILAWMGSQKTKNQIIVGFALETNDEEHNALKKLKKKNLDFIVLNSLNDKGAGFNHDTNKVKLLFSSNKILNFELKSKAEVAADIVEQIISLKKNEN